jgi:hypothetical protein
MGAADVAVRDALTPSSRPALSGYDRPRASVGRRAGPALTGVDTKP